VKSGIIKPIFLRTDAGVVRLQRIISILPPSRKVETYGLLTVSLPLLTWVVDYVKQVFYALKTPDLSRYFQRKRLN
jgi:hypothetical protein